jgi:Fe-S oxidoreductase
MAGAFGYMADTCDLSLAIGERSLLPAVRALGDGVIVAPGTSCRHQVKDATGKIALHPIELIADLMRNPAAVGFCPERGGEEKEEGNGR